MPTQIPRGTKRRMASNEVVMNTALAAARDPILMAEATGEAVAAGRTAFLAGRMPSKLHATASGPETGLIG